MGGNYGGELGDSSNQNSSKPIKVLENVVNVSLGNGHSGAITQDGSLYMWGKNQDGQLGDESNEDSYIPKLIDTLPNSHIVSVFPESGYSYVDLGTLKCSIKFDQNIENLERTASLVEYDTNKVVDTIDLNSVVPMGDELELLFNDNHSGNGTKLTADTKYYILLDEDAVELEDGTMTEGITDKDFWTLQTVPIEHSLIKNEDTNKEIEWNIYRMLFEPITARRIKTERPNGTGGLCFGFAYATGAWENEYSGIKAIGKSHSLMDVSLDTKGDLKYTYMEYLQLAQIYQYKASMTLALRLSQNGYNGFYNALTKFQNDKGPAIIFCVNNYKDEGHAIVPLGIISEDDTSVVIACYDCNGKLPVWENNQGGRYMNNLILKKSNGKFVDWSYREYNNLDNKKGYFRFCTVDEKVDKIMADESDYVKESSNLIHSQRKLDGLNDIISYGSAADNNTGRHLYWTEDNSISRPAGDSADISEIGITDGFHEISVSCPLNSDINLDLDTNTLQAFFDEKSEYTAVHTTADSDNDQIGSITIKGIASGSISTTKTEEGVILKGENLADVTASIENNTSSGEIMFSSEKNSVLIQENDNNLVISEDGNGNGIYDTVISTAPIKNREHTWDSGKITKEATCMEKGIKTYTCTVCGETKIEDIAMTAHNYKESVTAATVSKNGAITKRCTVCGTTKDHSRIYKIKSVSLNQKSYVYNGRNIKPSVTVKDSKGNKVNNNFYTLSYKDNKDIGEASVTITFKGKYTGKLTKKFKILPKGTSISGKLTAKSKQFTVKWKKQPRFTTGYQIQYSTSKKFTKKASAIKTVRKISATSLTVKNLKARKKYYVRIRTYKTKRGKKYYSAWSSIKNVTT